MKVEKMILDEVDKIEIVNQVPAETQKLFTSLTQYKGHTLFEINCTTGEIAKAKIETITADFEKHNKRTKVVINENCLYISCLNKKAAMKKYLIWLRGKIQLSNEEESHNLEE